MMIIIINYKYQAWKEEDQEEQGRERGAEKRQVQCEDDQGGGQGDCGDEGGEQDEVAGEGGEDGGEEEQQQQQDLEGKEGDVEGAVGFLLLVA